MADHARQQIRDAAKAALTGLPTTGDNVFSGRVSPLRPSEVPGWLLFVTGDDPEEGAYVDGPTAQYEAFLRCEGVATGGDDLQNTLDEMGKDAHVAIFSSAALLALLMVTPGPPSSQISIDEPIDGASKRTGSIVLTFPIQFRTRLGDPSIIV